MMTPLLCRISFGDIISQYVTTTQEEAHRQLISLLALNGRREAALKQYQICRHLLRDELGVEPQPETTALYKRVQEQTAVSPSQRRPLLVPLTPLIGRQAEIDALKKRLTDPACRLLTLLGPGRMRQNPSDLSRWRTAYPIQRSAFCRWRYLRPPPAVTPFGRPSRRPDAQSGIPF